MVMFAIESNNSLCQFSGAVNEPKVHKPSKWKACWKQDLHSLNILYLECSSQLRQEMFVPERYNVMHMLKLLVNHNCFKASHHPSPVILHYYDTVIFLNGFIINSRIPIWVFGK